MDNANKTSDRLNAACGAGAVAGTDAGGGKCFVNKPLTVRDSLQSKILWHNRQLAELMQKLDQTPGYVLDLDASMLCGLI